MARFNFFSDAILLFSTSFLQRVATIGLVFLAVKQLTAADFGTLTYIYGTSTSLSAFVGDVFGFAVLKYVRHDSSPLPENLNSNEHVGLNLLIGSYVAASLMSLLVFTVVVYVTDYDWTTHALPAGCIAFLIIVNSTWFALISSFRAIKFCTAASATGSLIILVAAFVSSDNTSSSHYLWIGAGGMLCSNVCYIIWGISTARNSCAERLFFYKLLTPAHYDFLWKTALSLVLGGPVHWICLTVLHSANDGAVQTAIFSAWFQWYLVLTFIPSALVQITIPWLTESCNNGNELFRRRLMRLWVFYGVLCTFATSILVMNIDYIIAYYPISYQSNYKELILMIITAAIAGLTIITMQAYLAMGSITSNLIITTTYSIAYLFLTIILVEYIGLGARGIILAIAISASLQFALQLIYIKPKNIQRGYS